MNNITKLSLIAVAIYSAYSLGKIKRIKKDLQIEETKIIKKGSFSKDIEILQKNINGIYGYEKLPISGAFCNKTKKELDHIFLENKFYNNENSAIDKQSLQEVNKILHALNNSINQ